MAKRFDVAQLFEPQRHDGASRLALYTNPKSTFDAMRDRKKGMSMFIDSRRTITARDGDLPEWLALAAERNLVVTLHAEQAPRVRDEDQPVHVFISRPEELWRVPAFLALWSTAFVDGRWSDAAENQMSYLLGYTEAERKRWIAAIRQERPAWGAATIHALLDADQRLLADSVGRRCFGPANAIEGMTLLYAGGGTVKAKALAIVPPGHTLARVGFQPEQFPGLFGPFKKMQPLLKRTVTKKLAPVVTAALVSSVQYLTRTGWK
ncbi:MAG: hypothetical protein H0V17_28920 [Deltaproteobacteria bacterium]|nr:hypothetical protein [Deltaproteobacteria bacterium]